MPQKADQSDSEISTTSGLRFSCRPIRRGSTTLPMMTCAVTSSAASTIDSESDPNCATDSTTGKATPM